MISFHSAPEIQQFHCNPPHIFTFHSTLFFKLITKTFVIFRTRLHYYYTECLKSHFQLKTIFKTSLVKQFLLHAVVYLEDGHYCTSPCNAPWHTEGIGHCKTALYSMSEQTRGYRKPWAVAEQLR